MKIGITLPQCGENATIENVLSVARGAEEIGLDSLWITERLIWPLHPRTPYPASPDGDLPVEYQQVLEPLATLAFVAAHTRTIQLGTSVIDILFHNPIVLAKQLTTIDLISRGRLIFGAGIGWSEDEYQVSNVPFQNRGKRADEFLEVLKRCWSDDVVEFQGEFYQVPPCKIGPRPFQKPHPKILVAGFVPQTVERVVRLGNGYLPIFMGPLQELKESLELLRKKADEAGSESSRFEVVVLGFPQVMKEPAPDGDRFPMSGSYKQIGEDLGKLKALNINHLILGGLTGADFRVEERLDTASRLATLARSV